MKARKSLIRPKSYRPAFSQMEIRDQLGVVEFLINSQYYLNSDYVFIKYRRYYLLRRLLALQIKEFNYD